MKKLFHRIIPILLVLNISNVFCLNSYQMKDTKIIQRNFSSESFKKGDSYFPINWYETYYPDLSHYEKTDWKPYSPNFRQPFHSLYRKDSYHRIKKLLEDKVATGVIIYLKNNKKSFAIVDSLSKELNIEIYPQIYNKHSGKNYPANKLEDYKINLLNQKNANVYFNDDLFPSVWDKNKTDAFAKIIRKNTKDKYLLSCGALKNYLDSDFNILDEVDIISPQLYPLRKKANIKYNLYQTIPLFYDFHKYYLNLRKLKELVLKYNQNHQHKIYEFVTLASYHLNRKNWAHISRFPTYEEFRYEFFTAIVCGAKGINIFSNYACNEKSYNNVKKIIGEFRDSGLAESLLEGKYSPKSINIESDFPKDNIDYCCYILDKIKYVIIINSSSEKMKISLKNNDFWEMILFDFETKKTDKNITKKDLLLKPFEVKILKIWR